MRQVDYKDELGRWYRVMLDDDAKDEDAPMGIPVGPPNIVDILELPEPFATHLHNQLFMRKLFKSKDIRKNPNSLQGALQAAFNMDVAKIHQAYILFEKETEV